MEASEGGNKAERAGRARECEPEERGGSTGGGERKGGETRIAARDGREAR